MDVDMIVEIPKGSRNKYEFDHSCGRLASATPGRGGEFALPGSAPRPSVDCAVAGRHRSESASDGRAFAAGGFAPLRSTLGASARAAAATVPSVQAANPMISAPVP